MALLWPVALLNYLDRQMLAAMKTSVMGSLPTIESDANWGFVLALFKWVYAGLSPIGGYIADRFSRRHVITASLFVWSLVTWLTGHVQTYEQLLATRALMGISEAFYIPAALALISAYHPGSTRSRAVGLHQTAIYFGVSLGGFSGYAELAGADGWRHVFSLCGLVGVAYALPLCFLLKDPAGRGDGTSVRPTALEGDPTLPRPPSPLGAVRELLATGSFILLVFYFTLPALAGWIVKDWMPAILKKQFDLGQGTAGVSATLFVNAAALTGSLLGGWWADRWMERSARGRIHVSAIGVGCLIPALFGVGNAPTLAWAIVFLTLFGIGWGFFDANNMPILCQVARPELRATGYGLMNLVSISCGGFADWGFGKLRDLEVPLQLIFTVFASVAAFSVILVLLIRPRKLEEG